MRKPPHVLQEVTPSQYAHTKNTASCRTFPKRVRLFLFNCLPPYIRTSFGL